VDTLRHTRTDSVVRRGTDGIHMKRGSLELDETVALIVTGMALLVLLTWWTITQMSLMETEEIERGRLSVLSHAKSWIDTNIPGVQDPHLFSIDYKRRVVTFNERGIEVNGKRGKLYDPGKEKYVKSYSALTPDIVNSVAAMELAICWYVFLEGKSYFTDNIDIDLDDTACYVCGELRFAPEVALTGEPEALLSYLASHQSRPYPQEREVTYLEYLYLQERLCDTSGKSKLPGTARAGVVGDSIGLKDGITWYDPEATESCEEQFLNKALIGGIIKEWGLGLPLSGMNVFDAIRFESYQPPMENIIVTPEESYYILFYQLGEDQEKKMGNATAPPTRQ
jgi:hypothetical protein